MNPHLGPATASLYYEHDIADPRIRHELRRLSEPRARRAAKSTRYPKRRCKPDAPPGAGGLRPSTYHAGTNRAGRQRIRIYRASPLFRSHAGFGAGRTQRIPLVAAKYDLRHAGRCRGDDSFHAPDAERDRHASWLTTRSSNGLGHECACSSVKTDVAGALRI